MRLAVSADAAKLAAAMDSRVSMRKFLDDGMEKTSQVRGRKRKKETEGNGRKRKREEGKGRKAPEANGQLG